LPFTVKRKSSAVETFGIASVIPQLPLYAGHVVLNLIATAGSKVRPGWAFRASIRPPGCQGCIDQAAIVWRDSSTRSGTGYAAHNLSPSLSRAEFRAISSSYAKLLALAAGLC
jgi:hypothetical protein